MRISNKVLLTGAGFTKNFGTPLAHEMWADLFNNVEIQKYDEIRDALYRAQVKVPSDGCVTHLACYYDYEAAFHQIMNSQYEKKIKDVMKKAMLDAYQRIDDTIINSAIIPNPGKWSGAKEEQGYYKMLNKFGEDNERSDTKQEHYFFTLNQDLLIERHYEGWYCIPGFEKNITRSNFNDLHNNKLTPKYIYSAPTKSKIVRIENRPKKDCDYFYIKLHGSYNWRNNQDENLIVTGYNKRDQAKNEPLLDYYFNVFENVLGQNNTHLLIVGYGFRDQHINDILIEHIKKSNLKLFIVNPLPIENFLNDFRDSPSRFNTIELKENILNALKGYYPYPFSTISNNDVLYKDFMKNYFTCI